MSGLIRPTAGTVVLDGKDISGKPAEKMAALGLTHVPENRLCFPTLSVRDNLALGAWTRKGGGDLDPVLELFPRLKTRLGQLAGTLSGGEQQMVAIGRGLMAEPTTILLDEPSIGLAPKVVAEIMEVLARLRDEKNLAVLNQAHKLKEATAAMAQVETARLIYSGLARGSEPIESRRGLPGARSARSSSRSSSSVTAVRWSSSCQATGVSTLRRLHTRPARSRPASRGAPRSRRRRASLPARSLRFPSPTSIAS